jgi:ectoine hydroxylase-related dioxygenase (phytanoyl-CoA dioxygenase family)
LESQIFDICKPAQALKWHRDLTTLLNPCDKHNFSIQIAMTKASASNCVAIIPGSHKLDHDSIKRMHNLKLIQKSLGGEYGTPTYSPKFLKGPKNILLMTMEAGEFFLFDNRTLHRTWFEKGGEARKAIALRVASDGVTFSSAAFAGAAKECAKPVCFQRR